MRQRWSFGVEIKVEVEVEVVGGVEVEGGDKGTD